MAKEMLDSSIIKPSQNAFLAPVMMVHKKEGLSSMCLDHREINKMTIRNKFHIPIIFELLDE